MALTPQQAKEKSTPPDAGGVDQKNDCNLFQKAVGKVINSGHRKSDVFSICGNEHGAFQKLPVICAEVNGHESDFIKGAMLVPFDLELFGVTAKSKFSNTGCCLKRYTLRQLYSAVQKPVCTVPKQNKISPNKFSQAGL